MTIRMKRYGEYHQAWIYTPTGETFAVIEAMDLSLIKTILKREYPGIKVTK